MSKAIRVPKRLKVRPQYRGMAIPYIAVIDDQGNPDFKVTDEMKRLSVIQYGLCQLCGDTLGKWMFFVGGTVAAEQNAYFEPGAHLDCLLYAMQVCPFIVGRIEHADISRIEQQHPDLLVKVDSTFSSVRNPWWVIKKATGWSYVHSPDGTLLLQPKVVKATDPLHPETMTTADWSKVERFLLTDSAVVLT